MNKNGVKYDDVEPWLYRGHPEWDMQAHSTIGCTHEDNDAQTLRQQIRWMRADIHGQRQWIANQFQEESIPLQISLAWNTQLVLISVEPVSEIHPRPFGMRHVHARRCHHEGNRHRWSTAQTLPSVGRPSLRSDG